MSVQDLIKSQAESQVQSSSAVSKDGQNLDFLKHIDEMDLSKITNAEEQKAQPEIVKININQVKWKTDP